MLSGVLIRDIKYGYYLSIITKENNSEFLISNFEKFIKDKFDSNYKCNMLNLIIDDIDILDLGG